MSWLKELSILLIFGSLVVLAEYTNTLEETPRFLSEKDVKFLVNPFNFLQVQTTTPRPLKIIVRPFPSYPRPPHAPKPPPRPITDPNQHYPHHSYPLYYPPSFGYPIFYPPPPPPEHGRPPYVIIVRPPENNGNSGNGNNGNNGNSGNAGNNGNGNNDNNGSNGNAGNNDNAGNNGNAGNSDSSGGNGNNDSNGSTGNNAGSNGNAGNDGSNGNAGDTGNTGNNASDGKRSLRSSNSKNLSYILEDALYPYEDGARTIEEQQNDYDYDLAADSRSAKIKNMSTINDSKEDRSTISIDTKSVKLPFGIQLLALTEPTSNSSAKKEKRQEALIYLRNFENDRKLSAEDYTV